MVQGIPSKFLLDVVLEYTINQKAAHAVVLLDKNLGAIFNHKPLN